MWYRKFKIVVLITIAFFINGGFAGNADAQPGKKKTVKPLVINRVEDEPESPSISDENLTPEQKLRLETFRTVWQTIKDNYFDQTFSGLDWKKIKTEYEPQIIRLESDAQLHVLLQKMIDRLNRSHFSIIPPEVIFALERAKKAAKDEEAEIGENYGGADDDEDGADSEDVEEAAEDDDAVYGIGVDLRVLENKFVITRIEPDSAAAKSGLKIGFIIEKVNSVSLENLLNSVDTTGDKGYKKQLPLAIVSFFLNGDRDIPVRVDYLDAEDKTREVLIEREKLSGETVKVMSNLPNQFVRFEAESLNEDTAYIKFNHYAVSLVDKFCGAVGKFKNKKNLIIDLRGNLGGSLGTMMGMISLLTDKTIKVGTEINKYGREDRFVSSQKKNFKGRIVILVDDLSYSAAEMFAAALQENGRAAVVGETSAGEALPSLTTMLPTGAVFLYPIANFETPKGNLLEGQGVNPNLKVKLERKTLLFGVDKQLESALAFLKTEPEKKQTGKTVAEVSVTVPPPPPKNSVREKPRPKMKVKQDARALQVIDEFVEKIGGKAALENVTSYSADGTVILTSSGAKIYGRIESYRDSPNKLAEIYNIDGVGRISEVYDGADFFAQSTVFGTESDIPEPFLSERRLFSEFNEILKMRGLYPQINYVGVYEREGKPTQLVEAVSADNVKLIFAFDEETKLLVYRSGTYGDATFGDYRKVGEILFPFNQTRGSVFEFNFTNVRLNEKPGTEIFSPEESCFDKTD